MDDLISALQRFYQGKTGDSRPHAEENRAPIHEANNSQMQHLAVKAKEWYEPGVPEGLYMATIIIYIRENGNWGYGSKLSSPEYIRSECGRAIGEKECTAAEIHWESVDVGE